MPSRSPPGSIHASNSSPISHQDELPLPASEYEDTPRGYKRFHLNEPNQNEPLPPLASLPGFDAVAAAAGTSLPTGPQIMPRSLGVHNILNPSTDASPSFASTVVPAPSKSPRVRKRGEAQSPNRPVQATANARQARRLITPKSPSLRASSRGRHSPTGLPHVTPLPSAVGDSRVYTAEPGIHRGEAIPPMPPPYTGSLSSSVHSSSRDYRSPPQISAVNQGPIRKGEVQAFVETPAQSSMRQSVDASPQQRQILHTPSPAASMEPTPGRTPARNLTAPPSTYQMQLDTDTVINVKVDTQHASKSADEKRRRNAGASARFRVRRKEKEVASAHQINDMQQELRELRENCEFYRNERNFFREQLERIPNQQIPIRPMSPRARQGMLNAPAEGVYFRTSGPSEPENQQHRRAGGYPYPNPVGGPLNPPGYSTPYASSTAPPLLPPPLPLPNVMAASTLMPSPQGPPTMLLQPSPAIPQVRPPLFDPYRLDPSNQR